MIDIAERFRKLITPEPARTFVRPQMAPRPPSPAEVQHALLHGWASESPAEFTAHLDGVIEEAHENAERSRTTHSEMNFWLGYERAIRDVRAAFMQWSHPDAGTPTSSALQGGLNGE